MLKKNWFVLFFFLCAIKVSGQECLWIFGAKSGGICRELTVDIDNDIISTGIYGDSMLVDSLVLHKTKFRAQDFIMKVSPDGFLKWIKIPVYATDSSTLFFESLTTDKQKNIFATGVVAVGVDFGNGVVVSAPTKPKGFLIKYNKDGVAQWVTTFEQNTNRSFDSKLVIDNQGNIVVSLCFQGSLSFSGSSQTVSTYGGGTGDIDVELIKYDSTGSLINLFHIGSKSEDRLTGLDISQNNEYYFSIFTNCAFNDSIQFGTQVFKQSGYLLLKTDTAFVPIIGKGVFTPNWGSLSFWEIAVRANGECVVLGTFKDTVDFGGTILTSTHPNNGYNAFVAYYTSSFNLLWIRQEQPSSTVSTILTGLDVRDNLIYFGGFYLGGNTGFGGITLRDSVNTSSVFAGKLDTLGNFLWLFSSGGASSYDFIADMQGNAVFGGVYQGKRLRILNDSFYSPINLVQGLFITKIANYSITRGEVYPGPYCAGDSMKIPFTKLGKYDVGNEFIAELSDSEGNFDGGQRELGRITDTTGGTINCVLPLFDVETSKNYRIRILSTTPIAQSYYRRDTLRLLIYSKDSANAGPDTLICKGQKIKLRTKGGSLWHWSPTTGVVNLSDTATNSIEVKPTATTEYRIIISDSSGCGVTDTDYVKVIVRDPLSISLPDTFKVCLGRTADVEAIGLGGDSAGYRYAWLATKNPISVISTSNKLSVNVSQPTSYFVSLSDGCSLTGVQKTVIVFPDNTLLLPKLADTTICKGNSVLFNVAAYACDSSAIKYTWDNGLGEGSSKQISPLTTTKYTVTATDTVNGTTNSRSFTVTVSSPLKVTLNPDTTICIGQTAQLRATPQGGRAATYSLVWKDQNDSVISNNKTTTVSPTTSTTYKAVLTDGCTMVADSAQITINLRAPLKITVNPDTTICIGQTANLRATLQGGNPATHKILWTANNSTYTASTAINAVTPNITTTYTALLTDGCTTVPDSAMVKITVRAPLTVSVNPDTTICVGETVTLKATQAGGNAPTYKLLWTDALGIWTDSSATPSVSPTTTTTYIAILSDACTTPDDSAKITITVRPPLQIGITAKDSICANQTILLTATATGGNSAGRQIQWAANNSAYTSLQNPATDTPKITTWYIATLTDNCSPTVKDSVFVTVLPTPQAAYTITPLSGCPPLQVFFKDESTGSDTLLNRWSVETTEITGTTNPSHIFTKTGYYTTSLLVSNALGCTDYIQKTNAIQVFKKPVAQFVVKPDVKEIETPLLLYNYSQDAQQYIWDFDNGNILHQNNRNDTTYTYTDSGTYTLKLVAENLLGCKDTQTQTIHVFDKIYCAIPSAFTPNNGDNLNDVFAPVCNGVLAYNLIIYNRWGQAILDCQNCTWNGTYDGLPVPSGIYMYKLQIDGVSKKKSLVYGTINVLR
jgi:gliding motility-associated-like protein